MEPIGIGSSAGLRSGGHVRSMGHAWGVAGGATLGGVIGPGADLPGNPQPWRELAAVCQHLHPGNSGGPLVDAQGRLGGSTPGWPGRRSGWRSRWTRWGVSCTR